MQGFKYNSTQNWATSSVATSGSGASFVGLNDEPCDEVTIVILANGVGLDIQGPSGSSTDYVSIDAPSGLVIPVSGNAKEVQVRRTDQSATPATVRYLWRKYSR